MYIGIFALGAIALASAIGWYLRHSRKTLDANLERLKEENTLALLQEQERLDRKKVTDRRE